MCSKDVEVWEEVDDVRPARKTAPAKTNAAAKDAATKPAAQSAGQKQAAKSKGAKV